MTCTRNSNPNTSVVFTPSKFGFHIFTTEVVDRTLVYQVIKMIDSVFICVNYTNGLYLNDLSLAMLSLYDKLPTSTQLLGDFSESPSKGMSMRISRKLSKNVFVSCNVDNDRVTLPIVEKRLYEEISKYPEKF